MNLLGRERRVSFVLSSHARFLSGAHEGQWDGEVGLYYLGARYYDPSLGRFLQEDALEGAADLPASQNRYIYCQNDPVALIDPTGYSPENTGTPARFTLGNIGNHGTTATACLLPDMSKCFSPSSLLWWGDHSPGEGSIYCFNASGFDANGEYSAIDTGKKDSQGNTIYRVTVGGVSVDISINPISGIFSIHSIRPLTATKQAIVDGLQAGFTNIVSRGGNLSSLNILAILRDSVAFAQKNLSTFGAMHTGSGNVIEVFFKHAVTGAAITQYMARGDEEYIDPLGPDHENYTKYDMEIAFWASYTNEIFNLGMGFWDTAEGPGLVSFANLFKAISWQESNYTHEDINDPSQTKDHGNGAFKHNDRGFLAVSIDNAVGANVTWESRFGSRPFQEVDMTKSSRVFAYVGVAFVNFLGNLAEMLTGDAEAIRKPGFNFGNHKITWSAIKATVKEIGLRERETPNRHVDAVWKRFQQFNRISRGKRN